MATHLTSKTVALPLARARDPLLRERVATPGSEPRGSRVRGAG